MSDSGLLLSKKFWCIASEHSHKKPCASSDALALYEHEDSEGNTYYDAYCYSCNQSFDKHETHNSSVGGELGLSSIPSKFRSSIAKVPKAEALTKDEIKAHMAATGYKANGYRGIRDEICQFFGHLTKLDENGEVLARFYPETEAYKLTGYKCRNHPKDFTKGKLGRTGINSDLSGQVKWKSGGGKYLLITAGEEDKCAAYQMLRDDQIRRGQQDFEPIHVVCSTVGEGGAHKQIAKHYDWIDSHEIIVLLFDSDKAGDNAVEQCCKVLPKDKVKLMRTNYGDANKALVNGLEKQFVRDFYGAKDLISDGVMSSIAANDTVEEELLRPKIPLPEFMHKLQRGMAGGIPLGYWVNWIAESGVGKSTTVNEAIRKWIYESPYKVGIMSLELTGAQYMIAMVSREVGYKINLIENPEDAVNFVRQPHVLEAREKLTTLENGEERFAILDDREGNLEHVKLQIEKLIRKHGCKLIVIDPLNDVFDGASFDEQAGFIKWMKATIKRGITFCCVCHVTKAKNTTDSKGKRILRELSESDVSGLSLITKSAGANIFLTRDKYSEDPIIKNTTIATMGKCRWTGNTGNMGNWFYENQKHTMYDFDDYFQGTATIDVEPEIYENAGFPAPIEF